METKNKREDLVGLVKHLQNSGVPDSQQMKIVKRFIELKARNLRIPLTGIFELTPCCNLDCKMCYVHLSSAQFDLQNLLPTKSWKELMEQAFIAGMREAKLSGGECLTYPGFEDLYQFLYNKRINIGIATNGLLIDQELVAFFQRFPPASIQVSIYGSSNEAYKHVTGHYCYETVSRNIDMLKRAKLPVRIAITPSIYMMDDIDDLLETVESFGIPYRVNATLFRPRSDTGRENVDLSAQEYVKVFKKWNEVKQREIKPLDIDIQDIQYHSKDDTVEYGLQCGAGRSTFAILYNGRMTPCVSLDELYANPLEIGFDAAWKKIIEIADHYPIPCECTKCSYRENCLTCAAAHKGAPEIGHCDPRLCERTREYIRAGIIKL